MLIAIAVSSVFHKILICFHFQVGLSIQPTWKNVLRDTTHSVTNGEFRVCDKIIDSSKEKKLRIASSTHQNTRNA